MLTLTRQQMRSLGKNKLPQFFKYIEEYIRREFPEFPDKLSRDFSLWVEEIYYESKAFGFETQREHIKYFNYKCIFGEDFLGEYDFSVPLLESDLPPKTKLSKLKEGVIAELRRGRST